MGIDQSAANMIAGSVLTITVGTGLIMLTRIQRHIRDETERRRRLDAVTLQALEALTLQVEPRSEPADRHRHLTAIPPSAD